MPADHGLSALGLIMQLFGSLFLGVMALVAMIPVLSGGMVGAWVVFVIGALSAVRSAFHRMAGTSLLYRSTQAPMSGVNIYIGVALAQTVIVLLLFKKQGPVPASLMVTLGLALAAWPLALLAITRVPRLRRLAAEIPTPEDLGFEGAAVLMIILGATGTLAMALYLWVVLKMPGDMLGDPRGLLLVATMVMLLVRSVMHVVAGVKGTRGIDSDGATEAAARYYNFGVVSSVIVGAVMLILAIMVPGGALSGRALLPVGLMVYMLLIWPLILRRFYSERNFGIMMEGGGPNYRRAPDAGLTALGWLLFAAGVFSLATSLPTAIFRTDVDVLTMLQSMASMDGDAAGAAGRSPWWSVGLALAQLWAALELIGMTDRHRVAGTAYGVIGTVVTLYLNWPAIKGLRALGGGIGPMGSVGELITVALAVVVPVCTVVLVNRRITPSAQARVRETPAT